MKFMNGGKSGLTAKISKLVQTEATHYMEACFSHPETESDRVVIAGSIRQSTE